jgi:hypothetical protein
MHANFPPNNLTTDHIEEKSLYPIQSVYCSKLLIIQAVFIASMMGKELGKLTTKNANALN